MKMKPFILTLLLSCLLFTQLSAGGSRLSVSQLCDRYIQKWCLYYPSQALAAGDIKAAFEFEALSKEKIKNWLQFNLETLAKLNTMAEMKSFSWDDRIDIRLLKRQCMQEKETWEQVKPHIQSAYYYSELISQAMTHILARNQMKPADTLEAVTNRLEGIKALCRQGLKYLENGSPQQTRQTVEALEQTAGFYGQKLAEIAVIQKWLDEKKSVEFKRNAAETAAMIRSLAAHIKKKVVPNMTLPDAMGKTAYNRKLKIYTDSPLSAARMEKLALEEIGAVRSRMAVYASMYWQKNPPHQGQAGKFKEMMDHALQAMESHRASNQQEFLKQFKQLIIAAETFVREQKIATITGKRTIFTALSPPHFAGSAVGGVYPAGPFQPEADTLFYLPTVPDSAPAEVKEGFYRSFNNHFNMMIITHEIVPGHYWHLKCAARHSRPVRSLFGGDVFAEGWATLCEQITLDSGWGNGDPLTYLAHLRKRLENAVRAYTSVQVHCNGWNKEQLIRFAVERGFLAPQFAANLWDRVIFSPHQLTSYFLGYRDFDGLLMLEKKRLGRDFVLRDFCDAVLSAGAMPMDMLEQVLRGYYLKPAVRQR